MNDFVVLKHDLLTVVDGEWFIKTFSYTEKLLNEYVPVHINNIRYVDDIALIALKVDFNTVNQTYKDAILKIN